MFGGWKKIVIIIYIYFKYNFLLKNIKKYNINNINNYIYYKIKLFYLASFLSMTLATDIIEFVLEIASIPDLICHATLIICSAAGKLLLHYMLNINILII